MIRSNSSVLAKYLVFLNCSYNCLHHIWRFCSRTIFKEGRDNFRIIQYLTQQQYLLFHDAKNLYTNSALIYTKDNRILRVKKKGIRYNLIPAKWYALERHLRTKHLMLWTNAWCCLSFCVCACAHVYVCVFMCMCVCVSGYLFISLPIFLCLIF